MSANLAASVRARLSSLARARKEDMGLVFTRYGLERLLYRLSQSPHAQRFLLKGALLFNLWYDEPHRPTRDVDLLGFGASDIAELEAVFRDVASLAVPDGLLFDPATVHASEIRKAAGYPGVRILMTARLEQARIVLQVDIGFGDAVVPAAQPVAYPTLLDMPQPMLRAYRQETVIAEKLHAMVYLGEANSRMKDFFDLWVMANNSSFELPILAEAVSATFARRETALPAMLPRMLHDAYGPETAVHRMWQAFLRKNGLTPIPMEQMQALVSRFAAAPLGLTGGVTRQRWEPTQLQWI